MIADGRAIATIAAHWAGYRSAFRAARASSAAGVSRAYRQTANNTLHRANQRTATPIQRQKVLYRVGFNPNQKGRVDPRTGERFLTGQYPTKAGVAGALRRVSEGRVQVRIYGQPAWDTKQHTSPPPDKLGNVYVTYFVPKSELEAALAGPGDVQDWVFQTGSYNFDRVLTVWVGEA